MKKNFFRLPPPPAPVGEEERRTATYVHWLSLTLILAALLLGFVNFLAGNLAPLIVALLAASIIGLALITLHRGHTAAASYVLLFALLIGTTLALATGNGIHDIAITLYPILIVIASFLLQRRGTLVMSVLVCLSAGIIIYSDIFGLLNIPNEVRTDPVDWVTVSLIFSIGALLTGYMSDTLVSAVRRARKNEHAIIESNEKLVQQAEQLRESEERWRALIQNAPDNILSIDAEGNVLLVNYASEISQRLVGKTIFDITPLEEHAVLRAFIAQCFEDGLPVKHEGYAVNPQGKLRWYAMRMSPVKDKDGKVKSLTMIATDISDRLETEKALINREQELHQRTRQLSMLNEIGRAVLSLRDIDGVLSVVFEKMNAILPMDAFFVALYDEETNEASYPLMYDSGRFWQQEKLKVDPGSTTGEILQKGKPVLNNRTPETVARMSVTDKYVIGDKKRISASIIGAPFILEGKVVGAVAAHSYDYNVYNQEHLGLLTGAAYQIAIALQNAHLYEEQSERISQLNTLNEISRSVATLQDLDTTLNLIQEQIQKAIKLDSLHVALYDPVSELVSFPLMYDSGKRWDEPSSKLREDTLTGKVIRTGEAFLVNRTRDEIAAREKLKSGKVGDTNRVSASYMFVPMQVGGRNIGIVSAHSYEIDAYDEGDLSLLKGAASQIAIAIENARLYENIRQRAEQLATLNEVGRTISSLRDLDSALKITLEQMQKILLLDVFFVGLYNSENATISFPLMFDSDRFWDEPETDIDPGGWVDRVRETRQPFLLNRTTEEIASLEMYNMLGDQGKPSASIMMVPMELDNRFLGVVSVQSYTINTYNQEHLMLLGNAANQIAIAVENARLYQQAKQRAEVMTAIYRLGTTVTSTLQIEKIFQELYENCRQILPLDSFYIATLDTATGMIYHPLFYDRDRRLTFEPRNIHTQPGLSGYIIKNKNTVYIHDTYDPEEQQKYQILHAGGQPTRSYLGVPLMHQGEAIGVISIQSFTPNAYAAEHISLLETISTQAAIALVNARLYENLQKELRERQQAEEEIRALNAGLEKRVQERTAELQSFTYTVSHDLRTPLRSINGYSRIFLEDYGDLIPTEGHQLLDRISSGARQMGMLIDDLLTFSRLSGASLTRTPLNMGTLAHDVFHDLTEHEDTSRINIIVHEMPPAFADPRLIRQVLINLISNGLKFTRHRETAQIEVGSQPGDDGPVYFVRDNGAGFSMKHADKLFGVFQRLHHQDEFEGTGVGLAIVQRIIHHHGGRIWAHAEPDKGATFYFTLGE